jgi:kumamolisin
MLSESSLLIIKNNEPKNNKKIYGINTVIIAIITVITTTILVINVKNTESKPKVEGYYSSLVLFGNNSNENVLKDLENNELFSYNLLKDRKSIVIKTYVEDDLYSWANEYDDIVVLYEDSKYELQHYSKINNYGNENNLNTPVYPNDISKVYKYPTILKKPRTVGVIGFGGVIDIIQIRMYWELMCNIPYINQPKIKIVSVDGSTVLFEPENNIENTIDVETIGCIVGSEKLTIILYYAKEASTINMAKGFIHAINDNENKVDVISLSWGIPEEVLGEKIVYEFNQMFEIAIQKGINIIVASGDSGSSDGIIDSSIHVDFPSSSPNVISCGGTKLTIQDDKRIKETLWSFNLTIGNSASGGGFSKYFNKPIFQYKNANKMRALPDIVLNGAIETCIAYIFNNQLHCIGGTSIAAPTYAALVLLSGTNNNVLQKMYEIKDQNVFYEISEGTNGYYNVYGLSYFNVVVGLGSINDGTKLALLLDS